MSIKIKTYLRFVEWFCYDSFMPLVVWEVLRIVD